MRAVIFAGYKESDTSYIQELMEHNDYIIACDGGLETIHLLGLKPDILIGDFDSVDSRVLSLYDEVERKEFPIEKDFSDLELCLEYCTELKPSEILILGAIGGRVDHCLSNIGLLIEYTYKGFDIKMYEKNNEIFVAKGNIGIMKRKNYLSIIPTEQTAVITLKGVKFELEKKEIHFRRTLTVSNEIKEGFAILEVHSGSVLVIQSN